jgi:hypothetical protein
MTSKATHTREEVDNLLKSYSLKLGLCWVVCPPNRFNRGLVKIILHDFRWYQFWRLITVIKAQKFLQSKLLKTVTVDWEAR